MNNVEVTDGVLSLCSGDASTFIQWLPEELSEFERYQLKARLISAIESVIDRKRAIQNRSYYDLCLSAINSSKPSLREKLQANPELPVEMRFVE